MLRRDFLKTIAAFCAAASVAKATVVAAESVAAVATAERDDEGERLLRMVRDEMQPIGILFSRDRRSFQIVYTSSGPRYPLADWEAEKIRDADARVRAGLAVPSWAEVYNGGAGVMLTFEVVA